MSYRNLDRARAGNRSGSAYSIVTLLARHGVARRYIAERAVEMGVIPPSTGGKWPTLTAPVEFRISWSGQALPYGRIEAGVATFRLDPSSQGHRRHRLFVKCPDCESWVQAGRFHQHAGSGRCLKIGRSL